MFSTFKKAALLAAIALPFSTMLRLQSLFRVK